MCQCPEPLQPPNETIKNCRLILQGLALGLLLLSVFAIFVGDIISILYYLMFIYMLYISWNQFNWCTTLFFFLFSTLQFIIALIVLIGLIVDKQLFDNQYILISIYSLLQLFFYSTAIFLSHYAYKHFKNIGMAMMGIGPQRNPDDYQQFPREREERQAPQRNNGNTNNVFQGQGVRIG